MENNQPRRANVGQMIKVNPQQGGDGHKAADIDPDKLPAYSEKYEDEYFEYRHVSLTTSQTQRLPKPMRILSEVEWRSLGVVQSRGWVHYAVHRPEPHVLLFRRPRNYGTANEVYVPPELLKVEEYNPRR